MDLFLEIPRMHLPAKMLVSLWLFWLLTCASQNISPFRQSGQLGEILKILSTGALAGVAQ